MTLLRKFGVLLAVLGLMVVMNLGTSLWAVSILQREVSVYLHSISTVLGGLNTIKRELSNIAATIPATGGQEAIPWTPPPGEPVPAGDSLADFEQRRQRIRALFESLEHSGTFRARAGISTKLNLESRVRAAFAASERWFESVKAGGAPDLAAAAESRRELFELHELIERNEAKILGDARQAVLHARDIRSRVLFIMLIALAVTAAAGALGLALVQRWVVRPVTELRTATDRIAAGDFAHRVPVQGRDEMAMLSAEVNHMAGMISTMQEERIERERLAAVGEMVRRLAHNLRNPLAGIRSLAELTRSDLPPNDPSQENQERIISTVDRFERWLAEMLSATTPLEIHPVPAPVAPWLAAVVDPLLPMAAAKGVEVRLETANAPGEAEFDGRHLEQALVGVITNAVQATPRGRAVTVAAVASGEAWEIRVEDQGPGIPPELTDKIFRPYFTTKRDGTGIGLAVARQVVEQHGGRISVRNAPAPSDEPESGGGAVFVLNLPLRPPSPPPAGGEKAGPRVANDGQLGGSGGQDPDSRGRSEPAVLHPADAQARRP